MKPEIQRLLASQAAWQRARAKLTWPEKIRMAEVMRESTRGLAVRSLMEVQCPSPKPRVLPP